MKNKTTTTLNESVIHQKTEMRPMRRQAGLIALEQRFMFDGAAASDVLQVTEYVTALEVMPAPSFLDPAEVHAEVGAVEPALILPRFSEVSDTLAVQLNEAILHAESGVRNFLTSDSAIQDLLSVYGSGSDSDESELQNKLETLRQDVLTHGLDVQLKLLDSATLKGALGAFAASTPDRQPTIYLNRDWLEGEASSDLLNRVLTEELGHALDELLRPQLDAAGDEGKRFVQLVAGNSPDSQEFIKNDHFEVRVDGELIDVEAAFPVFDVQFRPLNFSTGSRVSGSAGAVGETHLYSNVFTTSTGQQLDAVVSLSALTNATLSAFDSTSNPYATTASFQPNLNFSSVGGFATFNFSFILSGTYQNSSNPGSSVDLRNVIVNSYDLDGSNSSASGRQFTDFSGIGGYTVSTSSQIVVSEPSAGVTRFQTTIGGNITSAPGTAAGDNIRVRVTFDQLSTISVKVGDAGATGLAYFGIDFSEGTTFTNAKVADIAVVTNGSIITSEGGTTDTFTVALQSAPTANVTVNITGLDASEGTLSASTLTFTPTNWNTAQTVTVTGVDDSPVDGDIGYTLTATATSTDIAYKGRTAVVDVVNTDNDVPIPLTVNNITVNEASPYGVFEVQAEPNSLVTMALAVGSAPAATGLGTDYSAVTGSGLQYLDGSTWTNYTVNTSVSVGAAGKLLVRTAIVNDSVADNSETFKLNVTDAGGTIATGIATIKDDGTGTIFNADGTNDTTSVRDDDRALAVNSISVNEASPYAVFEVTGAVNQLTQLNLALGATSPATGSGTDYGAATGTGLEYLVGSTWTSYTANANVSLGATGKLLVRTAIVNDSVADNNETFRLSATNTGGTAALGEATIKDDGTGTIFKNDGTDDATVVRDDDRALSVNSISVNEASTHAVFEVTGTANQLAKLALANGTISPATGGGTDYSVSSGVALQYLVGTTWTNYTAGSDVSLGASGKLLVRTAIVNDAVADNDETFRLSATNLSGVNAFGVATIKDDGTGTIFKTDGTNDATAVRDDERALAVNSISVNEASPYAVFEVTGAVNQLTKLNLALGTTLPATGSGTDYGAATGTGLEYLVGNTWTSYTANANVSLGATGKLLVRTAVVNDGVADNNETFKLNSSNTAGATASGVATIKDDGTGDIFKADGSKDLTAPKDDDRTLAVNSITVNEASPYAVFEITGAANQLTSLALAAGTSPQATGGGVDYGTASGTGLEYWTGSAWAAYTSGLVALNGSGVLLVRTPVINDSTLDGGETFALSATNTAGATASGVATIKDDGTGTIYKPDGTVDPAAPKDNDAFVALPTVTNITVNEASPYAVLQVTGQLGQMVSLSLEAGTATAGSDYNAGLEYSINGGSNWAAYSTAVALNGAGGTLLVRVPVLPDTPNEPDETFVLKVTTTANTFATGTVTIVDDANGVIFNADGTENTTAVKDDDRVITITNPEVNEGSSSALFVLTGVPGQNAFIYDGTTLIHSFTFGDTGSYGFFYSYAAEQETAVDGPETKTLTVKTQSGTASTGTATIRDDGTGSYWVAGNATPLTNAQLISGDIVLDDDRVVSVNDIAVNEASPYAVFTVTGQAGQRVSLALAVGSTNPATAAGTDYSQSTGAVLQYFDGTNWVNYTPGTAGPGAGTGKYAGTVALDATGSLMVRTRIANDAVSDNSETFKLNVTNTGGVTTAGVATIKDDGTGIIFKNDGTDDANALRDDDRAVTVTGTTVNEASSHVVFTVAGLGGQLVQFSLTESGSGNGHALVGTDTGLASQLEYLDGTTWTSYTGGYVTLAGSGASSMLVRVAVKNDALNEGAETLKLIASTTGVSSNGLSTIRDDGLGSMVTFNGSTGAPTYTSGPGAAFDDDRPLTIADINVAESGGHAVFNVNGFGGQYVKLALVAGTATSVDDFGAAIEYYNGTAWTNYTPNALIQIPGTAGVAAALQVRTALVRDAIEEPIEQFRLVATNAGTTEGRGTATITDNAKPALLADTAVAVEQGGSANATLGVDPGGNLVTGTVVSGNLGLGGADSDSDGDTLTVASVANTAVSSTVVATPTSSPVNVQGAYGVLSVNNAGAYNYTVTNTNANVQALRTAADTLTETFTYKVADGWGGESTSTLTVTIRGANDAPEAVADFNVAKESLAGSTGYVGVTAYSTTSDATYDALGYKATGSVLPNDTEVDVNDTRTVLNAKVTGAVSATTVNSSGVSLTGTYGDLLIRADGTYTYTPNANSPALSEGQSANDVFVYTLQDAAGLTSTANLTITVYGSGSNDPDAVDDANTVVEAGGTTTAVAATGNVLGGNGASAGDHADTTPLGTGALEVSDARSTSASSFTAVTTSTVINGQYGVLTISSTGAYSYTLTNTLTEVQALQAGQTLSESFIYQVKNGPFGASQRLSDAATLTITVTGTNDAPTLDLDTTVASANFSATFTEGGQAVSLSTAAGVNLADVDSASLTNVTVTIAQTQVLDGSSEELLVRGATAGGTLTLGDPTAASGSVTLGGLAYSYERSVASGNLTFVFKGPSGAALTTAQAESLLDALSYQNTSDNPTVSGNRVFNLSVTDSGSLTSNNATSTIAVVAVNDAPVLDLDADDSSSASGANYRVNYSIGGAVVSVADADRLVSDVDDAQMDSATLVLTNAQSGDVLAAGSMPAGITASVGALTNGQITVTLSGSATKSGYETAIRAITFSTTSANWTTRDVQVVVSDGALSSNLANTSIAISPDNRPVTVAGTQVNEKSPFVLFTVSGAADQLVSLQLDSMGNSSGHATLSVDTQNASVGFVLQYLSGATWTNYSPGAAVALDSSGSLLVRTAVQDDAISEGVESLQLIARNGAGTANATPGLSTIRDDGQGSYFASNNTTSSSVIPGGVVLDDDRALSVNTVRVNEASPYAVFEVTGAVNQLAKLALDNGISPLATAGGVDYANNTATVLQYLVGNTWTNYTANENVSLGATGKLFVRTAIINDTTPDSNETFKLTATNTGSGAVSGLATIMDDGTGDVFRDDGTVNPNAIKDDERSISVSDITVNEGSTHAVFEVAGFAGQLTSLELLLGSSDPATAGGVDYSSATSSGLQYRSGSSWVAYSSGTLVPLDSAGKLLVRTAIINDAISDNNETFRLKVVATGGASDIGVATIKDDGTGDVFELNGAVDPQAIKDDDRSFSVTSPTVNEASPYAVFTVGGAPDQWVSLVLSSTGGGLGHATAGADYTSSVEVSVNGGLAWSAYTSGVNLNSAGSLLVRVPVLQDSVNEPDETFRLTVANAGGSSVVGTATIQDDGNGTIYKDDDGSVDSTAPKDDDRGFGVSSPTVNEASPRAVFVVDGSVGQVLTGLVLQANTASALDFGDTLEISQNNGMSWTTYTTGSVTMTGAQLLVRTPIKTDDFVDNNETFTLTVSSSARTAIGTATIKDDGTGVIYAANGQEDIAAVKNTDQPLVTGTIVNEASPYVMWTVSDVVEGQSLKLSLLNTTDMTDLDAELLINGAEPADVGSILQYWNGSAWTNYQPGLNNGLIVVPGDGDSTADEAASLKVRLSVINDVGLPVLEGSETLALRVELQTGQSRAGVSAIVDDGSGSRFDFVNDSDFNPVITTGPGSGFDDDRSLIVYDTVVNEGSPYAVFRVAAVPGMRLILELSNVNDTAAKKSGTGPSALDGSQDFGPDMQYFDGLSWVNYTPNSVYVVPVGSRISLVRTPVINDTVFEGLETFTLTARTEDGTISDSGTGAIIDDGTSVIFNQSGAEDRFAFKNDDRSLKVNSIEVNEGSEYGVFTVTGTPGITISSLALANTTSTQDVDAKLSNIGRDTKDLAAGVALQYSLNNGADWLDYSGTLTIPNEGQFFVRVGIQNDFDREGAETFQLVVTTNTSQQAVGLGTIFDDGTGIKFPGTITGVTPNTNTLDLDDDFDKDGIPFTVEEILATMAASVGWNTAGLGDLNGDGLPDAKQNALATLAWTTVDQFQDALNGTLTSIRPIISLAVMPNASGSVVSTDAQLENIKVLAPTDPLVGGSKPTGPNISAPWDPIQFSITKRPVVADVNLMDVDTSRLGLQVRVLIDVSASQMPEDSFNAYMKYVSADAFAALPAGTLDNAGTPISGAGWYDFTQRVPGGDGARFITNNGLLTGIELIITDNAFGDNNSVGGMINDPGLPVFITEPDPVVPPVVPPAAPSTPVPPAPPLPLLSVSSVTVNEASPYAFFTVSGQAEQAATLALTIGSAGAADFGPNAEILVGNQWVTYAGQTVQLDSNGQLLVRTPIVNDLVFEGPETFSLTARNAAGVAASGTATIRDEGQGEVRLPDGGVDLGAIKDDDRSLSVSSMTVNEASPFAFFTVAGQAGQTATLQLANGSAGAQDFGPGLEVLVGDQWIPYSGQAVTLDATGRLSVRTALVNDGVFEGAEDFRLIAQNAVGVAASGVATILDDGQGEIRAVDGALDLVTVKNDDRSLDVSSSTVNEASPFAFFTVTGPAGQVLTLQLNPGSASEQDYGPVVEVFNGVNWESYSGQLLQLDPNGRLQVRTTLTHDQVFEGAERFSLSAIKTNGQSAQGTMTILDDGTGDVYRPDGRVNSLVAKDDDRRSPPPVAPPPVDLPQPVWIPLSPERWMPHAGEYELHHRWYQERDQETSAHTPLRFDSALQPRLNLDSAKDLGLTEPVVTDASQRLTTYDWLQVLPPNSSSSVVADDDVTLALQPKLLPGLSKPQVGSASKWVFDMPRDVLFDASKQGSVTLSASLTNGQALPDWLAFDANLGRFEVSENERLIKEVLVDVHVQSSDGSMTSKAYQLDMTALSESAPAPLPARQGLTEKLKLAAKGNVYVQLPVETVSQ